MWEGGRYLVAQRPDLLLCELLAFSQCLDIPILRCVRVGGGHSASKPPQPLTVVEILIFESGSEPRPSLKSIYILALFFFLQSLKGKQPRRASHPIKLTTLVPVRAVM